ncbi:MAG TPA: oligosaccharide flippase family protein [Pyrinomonadaceae bacterium]|jgi:O-antigen/teichoic acid export membrane protein
MVSSTQTVKPIDVEGGAPAEGTRSLRRLLAQGGATLGFAVMLDRGFGFLANLLAARAAGPQSFGAYSVVLATAGTVASYAGAGIGSTANRFSGKYPVGSPGYRGFLRTIILVSLCSAFLAALLMLAGAVPLARVLLRNEGLVGVLQVAAFSAGALILLECLRGLLIGQQRFQALILLSVVSGTGMLLVLPLAARAGGAAAMICGQAGVALLAVAACALFSRRLGIAPATLEAEEGQEGPGAQTIVKFGLVQFGAAVGLNIASWWLASLVARADVSLLQMGMYAVANQFRGLASILPGLLGQVTYPLLTAESGRHYGGPDRVVLINTFLSTSLVIIFAGLTMAFLPWILPALYGQSYTGAEVPSILLLATAISHMGGAAAANRVSIVNLRALGVINGLWAAGVVLIGIWLVPLAGATGAATAFFLGHLFSQAAVLVVLKQAEALPRGLLRLTLTGMLCAIMLTALAYFRAAQPSHRSVWTFALSGSLLVFLFTLLRFGARRQWLPRFKRVE